MLVMGLARTRLALGEGPAGGGRWIGRTGREAHLAAAKKSRQKSGHA
jgi:hypothetical protein